jgi:hypothetical protein
MYTRLPEVASTCALEYTRWDRPKPAGNPKISAADLRALRRFHGPLQLAERAVDMHAFATPDQNLSELKGSANSPQMHQWNSIFEGSAVSWQLLTDRCTCDVRSGRRVYIAVSQTRFWLTRREPQREPPIQIGRSLGGRRWITAVLNYAAHFTSDLAPDTAAP